MGKDKDLKTEAPGNAFSRMNYLYQAANLIANSSNSESNHLSNYYIKIMKEISKKVVEKLHPDLKRTICCACNNLLTPQNDEINVKVKTHKKKKRKKSKDSEKKILDWSKFKCNKESYKKYQKNQINVKNKRPNKVYWSCKKCGFSKGFLQRPSHKLWIHVHNFAFLKLIWEANMKKNFKTGRGLNGSIK